MVTLKCLSACVYERQSFCVARALFCVLCSRFLISTRCVLFGFLEGFFFLATTMFPENKNAAVPAKKKEKKKMHC